MNAKHQYFYETALTLVHKKGFKATTMRDLAQAMNCDVSNIYNYINSKQELLERVLFDISDTFHEKINEIASSAYGPIDQLKQVVRLFVELSIDRHLELSLLNNEWRNLKHDKLENFISQRALFEQKVQAIIEKGKKQKCIITIDEDLATHLFLSSLRLLFNQYSDTTEKFNKIELERQIGLYIFKGLTA